MKAAGTMNGLRPAMDIGEKLAVNGHEKEEPYQFQDQDEPSRKLAAILVWSLESTVGPQQSIVVNRRIGTEDDGIRMWVELIRHFEKGSADLRKIDLHQNWENCVMKLGEHPNVFYGRLEAINSKLANLGVEKSEEDLMIRLIAAIEREDSGIYKNAIQQYRGALVSGIKWTTTALLEFLTQIYDAEHREDNSKPVLKGFVAKETRCEHCNRIGHAKNESRRNHERVKTCHGHRRDDLFNARPLSN